MQPLIAVPATLLLLFRAWYRGSLTPLGLVAAAATATAHALHPWSIFFALLAVFFIGGTTATKIKHDIKAELTLSSSGATGGEGARTHVQVFANTLTASVFILLHARQLRLRSDPGSAVRDGNGSCWLYGGDLLVVGIVASYAAVAADTFSSELGILSPNKPRLITSPTLREVPPGTNGGVTPFGVFAGFLGALTVAVTSAVLLPFCTGNTTSSASNAGLRTSAWTTQARLGWVLAVSVWGTLGSLLDSFLGGWLQASVVDTRSGKVIEAHGGKKVLVPRDTGVSANPGQARQRQPRVNPKGDSYEEQESSSRQPSRKVESGLSLLDNNGVNFLMAFTMGVSGMIAAGWYWSVPLRSVIS